MKVKKKSEPGNVKVSGIAKEVPASLPTEFTIDTKSAGFGDLNVVILDPKGKAMRYWKTDFKDGTYKITFVPEEVGEHKVGVEGSKRSMRGISHLHSLCLPTRLQSSLTDKRWLLHFR